MPADAQAGLGEEALSVSAPTELEWLDGPGVVRWLEEWDVRPSTLSDNAQRRLQSWKNGTVASVWALDRILTPIGLHISMVPETLYVPENPHAHRGMKYTDETLAEAASLIIDRRRSYKDVMELTGMSRSHLTNLVAAERARRRG